MELIRSVIDNVLDNPMLFNNVRYILAGKQLGMKRFIAKAIRKFHCRTIADICSGTGDFVQFGKNIDLYVGWDLNPHFVTFAAKRYRDVENVNFVVADITKSKFVLSQQYDAVLLISAVHHFSDLELAKILPVIQKITKKVLIIADIIPDPPHALQRFFVKLDRGRFVRPKEEKVRILSKYFDVRYTKLIPTKSAVQFGMVCVPKRVKK